MMNLRTTWLKWIGATALAAAAAGPLGAENPVAEIRRSHQGERASAPSRFQVRGTAVQESSGDRRRVPFVLTVSEDRSRLEMGDRVFLRQGVFGQWFDRGGPRSSVQRVWEGLRDVYLLPFFAVNRLPSYSQARTASDSSRPSLRYQRSIERRTHFGYRPKTPLVELDFDAQTRLLNEALFGTLEGQQSIVSIQYRDYALVDGLAVPRLVVRQVGDAAAERFHIEDIDFAPKFDEHEFDLVFQP